MKCGRARRNNDPGEEGLCGWYPDWRGLWDYFTEAICASGDEKTDETVYVACIRLRREAAGIGLAPECKLPAGNARFTRIKLPIDICVVELEAGNQARRRRRTKDLEIVGLGDIIVERENI